MRHALRLALVAVPPALGVSMAAGCGEDVVVDYPFEVPPAVSRAVPPGMEITHIQEANMDGEAPIDTIFLFSQRRPDETKVVGLVAQVDGSIATLRRPGWELELGTRRRSDSRDELVLIWLGDPTTTEVVFWEGDGFRQACESPGAHPSGC